MDALCDYFGKCGGCSLQNVEYYEQLSKKKEKLMNLLKIDGSKIKVFHGQEYHYRNRMDLIFNSKGIGFRRKGNWKNIIDIKKCVISNEKLNHLIGEVRDFFKDVDYFDVVKQTGTFKYAVIRTPTISSSISFVLNSDSTKIKEAVELIKQFTEFTTADSIIVSYVKKKQDLSISDDYFVVKGEDFLKEKLMNKEFHYSVQGFFQNNTFMAEKMQEYIHEMLSKYNTKDSELLDLYGGVGTFGIINSKLFKNTLIAEAFKLSIDYAKENIRINDSKADAIVLDAKNLYRLEFDNNLFVITDPPRSGMHQRTIKTLKDLNPEVIIYISCNAEQLAKEIKKLGYSIKSVAMFDLFPQTWHMETVVELIRSKED